MEKRKVNYSRSTTSKVEAFLSFLSWAPCDGAKKGKKVHYWAFFFYIGWTE